MCDRVPALRGIGAIVRRHVGQDGVFAQVILDHRRHIRINGLVVGGAAADRVGQSDVAGAIGVQQADDTQSRIDPEIERVKRIIVDPAIDHVDALQAGGGLHVDDVVAHDEVLAFNEFDTHEARQQGMLKISGVEDSRRQHDDRRFDVAERRGVRERGAQAQRIVIDR